LSASLVVSSCFCVCRHPPEPHSFPTRRSSDLTEESGIGRHSAPALERAKGLSPIAASVVGALDELPDDQRAVFLLKEVAHLPLRDRKSTRLNSSHVKISYAVFCLKKKKKT